MAIAHLTIRLVQQHAAMWKCEALALSSGSQQDRSSTCCLAKTNRRNVILNELHRVVNREQSRDVATRTVDVDVDVFIGVFTLEVNQLCADQVGDGVVDRRANEKNVLFE